MKAQVLRHELVQFQAWLCQLLHIDAIEMYLSTQEPLTATYKWQGAASDDRFLLAMEFKAKQLKLFHLWLPGSKQRQGIGSAIVAQLRSLCSAYHLEAILIEPRPGSEGFWLKHGFVPPSDRVSHWRLDVNGQNDRS